MASKKSAPIRGSTRPAPRPSASAGQYDLVLVLAVAALIGAGLIMIFSASFIYANRQDGGTATLYLVRQLRWLGLGTLALLVASRINYQRVKPFTVIMMAITVLLLILVLFGEKHYGSRRHLFGTSVQPSEFAKLTVTFYIAYWLTSKGARLQGISQGLMPFAVLLGFVAALIAAEPDFDTTALIVVTALLMFFVAGASMKQMVVIVAIGAATFYLATTRNSYVGQRLTDYWEFLRDPSLGSDQVRSALSALMRGGIFGAGLGSGQNIVQLPFTDSIFAMIGFETGIVGALLVIGLFVTFAYRGLRLALRCPDHFGSTLGIGITAWITIQAFLNMAVNLALLPYSGLTLPFISYGGSSLLVCMTGVGVLLSISRYGSVRAAQTAGAASLHGAGYATPHFRWRNWRSRLSFVSGGRRVASGRMAARQRAVRPSSRRPGYEVKSASAPRVAGLNRRITRARRRLAQKTSPGSPRRIPRRR